VQFLRVGLSYSTVYSGLCECKEHNPLYTSIIHYA